MCNWDARVLPPDALRYAAFDAIAAAAVWNAQGGKGPRMADERRATAQSRARQKARRMRGRG